MKNTFFKDIFRNHEQSDLFEQRQKSEEIHQLLAEAIILGKISIHYLDLDLDLNLDITL